MKVCLFDIDGTLLNSGGAGQAAMEAALAAEFQTTEQVHGISAAGRTDRAIVADLFAFYGIADDDTIRERFLDVYLGHLPNALSSLDGRVLPGIQEVLADLHPREDVLLGLLTGNFERGATAKLNHFGLQHYFRCGGFGDVHHHRDDVARAAKTAVRELHPEPLQDEDVWVIGDTPHDVTCARAIGARVVAVATGLFNMDELAATQPDHLFEDFSQPQLLLDVLLSSPVR